MFGLGLLGIGWINLRTTREGLDPIHIFGILLVVPKLSDLALLLGEIEINERRESFKALDPI